MQFTVNNAALVGALAWVTKSLPARPSAPVLAGLKLSVANDTLTIAAFDYEQSAVATIPVEAATEGTVLVSGRLFADIARALPKGDVQVALDGTKVRVQAKASKFSVPTMPIEDYPTLPERPAAIGSVDANLFAEAVRSVVTAAGRDEMLPVLTAVYVKIDPNAGTLTLAATDRFRLAVRNVAFDSSPGAQEKELLVPARILDGWAKSLTGEQGTRFTFGTGDDIDIFSVESDGRSATVRLLDGSFPKFEALIPKDFTATAVVDSTDLVAAVKRVAIVAEGTTPASLAFTNEGITISATSDSTASEEIDAEHAGNDIRIGFNVAYLLDGLNALGGKEARFSLVAANRPAVITPIDTDSTDGASYTYLLMPMRGGA